MLFVLVLFESGVDVGGSKTFDGVTAKVEWNVDSRERVVGREDEGGKYEG